MKVVKYQAWSNKYQKMFRVREISMDRDGYIHGLVDAGFENEHRPNAEEFKSPLAFIGRVDFVKSTTGKVSGLFQNPSDEVFFLREYTNVDDDNGVEIYSGDIVKRKSRGKVIIGVVVFEKGAYVIIDGDDNRHFLYPKSRQKTEVVGDIFQNRVKVQ